MSTFKAQALIVFDKIGKLMDESYDQDYGFHKPDGLLFDIAELISPYYRTRKYINSHDKGMPDEPKYTRVVYPLGFTVPPEEYMADGKVDAEKINEAIRALFDAKEEMMTDYKDSPLVCVDFDGTIAVYDGWRGVGVFGDPIPGTRDGLNWLRDQGYQICIFTTRGEVDAIADYMDENELPYDYINDTPVHDSQNPGKPPAKYFIDDRAIRFEGSWKRIVRQIEELDEIEMTRNGAAYHVGISDKPTLDDFISKITPENVHPEWGGEAPSTPERFTSGYMSMPLCWCGETLIAIPAPDFFKDKVGCTLSYGCPKHGDDYIKPRCWCGARLMASGIGDFYDDDRVVTMSCACELHGQYYMQPQGIGISGRARAGKDCCASLLSAELGWPITHFADELKREWYSVTYPDKYAMNDTDDIVEEVNRLKIETTDVRQKLIEYGQWRREQDPLYWVKKLDLSVPQIVADMRFQNEALALQANGFFLIRIECEAATLKARGCPPIDDISETDLSLDKGIAFNRIVHNDGPMEDFQVIVQKIAKEIRCQRARLT